MVNALLYNSLSIGSACFPYLDVVVFNEVFSLNRFGVDWSAQEGQGSTERSLSYTPTLTNWNNTLI